MTIEQKIFSRRRFSTKRMENYGFENKNACYTLSKEFMDGDFTAEIRVYENGSAVGRVMDNMMGEEYIPLRMPNYTGAFVGSVRAAYEELLFDIADSCCTDVAFASDQSNRIAAMILDKYSVEPDFPWDEGEHEPVVHSVLCPQVLQGRPLRGHVRTHSVLLQATAGAQRKDSASGRLRRDIHGEP